MVKKPYLIIPKLVEQPTWGGKYILEMKGWDKKKEYANLKIGQSYELSSETKLSLMASSDDLLNKTDSLSVSCFKESRPFPLIKFTQALGNSFQLHIKQSVKHPKWQPKAESWYFLERGQASVGIKKGISLFAYKLVCKEIEEEMKRLSLLVREKKRAIECARQKAREFALYKDPWQFVNVITVEKNTLIDLSVGGIHHSWEENKSLCPLGNIVYEVQQDVPDEASTLRSFDQGKLKENGEVRDITIDDYFAYLDAREENNIPNPQKKEEGSLVTTPYYSLHRLNIEKKIDKQASNSFHHLFVEEGEVQISSEKGSIFVRRGHSCFIPSGVVYSINPTTNGGARLLQTFLP